MGEILEDGLVTSVVARLADDGNRHREDLGNLPVLTEGGRTIRLGDVATVHQDLGPSIVRREHVRRVAVLTANISGRDLTGTVEAAREALEAELERGITKLWRGQLDDAQSDLENILKTAEAERFTSVKLVAPLVCLKMAPCPISLAKTVP